MTGPVVRRSFTPIADSYDETRGGLARGARFARMIAPHLTGPSVLEVGVGTGVVARGLADLGVAVRGIDISAEMLARAVPRVGHRVCVADSAQLPIASGSIDTCYSVWVLHLVDIEATLRQVWRVLVPGGRHVQIGAAYQRSDDVLTAIVDQMMYGLRGGPARDHPQRLTSIAERIGFAVERTSGRVESMTSSPAEVLHMIESRSFSHLWGATEEQWRRHVQPALARLRALPQAPVVKRETPTVLLLNKPVGKGRT